MPCPPISPIRRSHSLTDLFHHGRESNTRRMRTRAAAATPAALTGDCIGVGAQGSVEGFGGPRRRNPARE
eukprot:scaffold26132_cov159-Isochrysis_galbana.AAC.2